MHLQALVTALLKNQSEDKKVAQELLEHTNTHHK